MNNFVDKSIDNLIVGNDNRLFGSDFNKPRYFYGLLHNFLYLINLGNFVDDLNYFILANCHLLDSFLYLRGQYWLLSNHFHFSQFLSNIWYNLFDFCEFLSDNRLLLDLCDFLHNYYFLDAFNYSFDVNRNLFYFFYLFLHQD
jgi:hypothetical protein